MKFIEESLRKRPTYDEVIDYIENKQPKIKYPNRTATFLRNSPYLSQFDGDSWIDLETQENNIERERLKESAIKRITAENKGTAQLTRAFNISTTPKQTPSVANSYEGAFDEYLDDLESDEKARIKELEERVRRYRELIPYDVSPST